MKADIGYMLADSARDFQFLAPSCLKRVRKGIAYWQRVYDYQPRMTIADFVDDTTSQFLYALGSNYIGKTFYPLF